MFIELLTHSGTLLSVAGEAQSARILSDTLFAAPSPSLSVGGSRSTEHRDGHGIPKAAARFRHGGDNEV